VRPVRVVEVCHAFSGEFEMLALVFTNWDVCSSHYAVSIHSASAREHDSLLPVEKNVCSHKNRI
jgi:hypothetical protein